MFAPEAAISYDGIDFRFTGPVQLARDGRLGKRLIKTDYNNFAPRLGIAFSPSSQWSFRAGFGVFFSQESKNSIFDLNRGMGGRASVVPDVQAAPVLSYNNFINASQLPVLLSSPSGLTWGADSNLATTYTMSYLFNIQRTLCAHSILEIGYAGNQSRKLAMLINANGPLPGITPFTSRAPYPEWQEIQFITGDGVGNYNALSGKLTQHQVKLNKVVKSLPKPVVRSGTRRIQCPPPLRDLDPLHAALREGEEIPQSWRRPEPGAGWLAVQHDHHVPGRDFYHGQVLGFRRAGHRPGR